MFHKLLVFSQLQVFEHFEHFEVDSALPVLCPNPHDVASSELLKRISIDAFLSLHHLLSLAVQDLDKELIFSWKTSCLHWIPQLRFSSYCQCHPHSGCFSASRCSCQSCHVLAWWHNVLRSTANRICAFRADIIVLNRVKERLHFWRLAALPH